MTCSGVSILKMDLYLPQTSSLHIALILSITPRVCFILTQMALVMMSCLVCVLFAQAVLPNSECRVRVCLCCSRERRLPGHRLLHQPFLLFSRTMNTSYSKHCSQRKKHGDGEALHFSSLVLCSNQSNSVSPPVVKDSSLIRQI